MTLIHYCVIVGWDRCCCSQLSAIDRDVSDLLANQRRSLSRGETLDTPDGRLYDLLALVLVDNGRPLDHSCVYRSGLDRDRRVEVVHAPNVQTAASARNIGAASLAASEAGLLVFFDADDQILPGSLHALMEPIATGQCEITAGGTMCSERQEVSMPTDAFFYLPMLYGSIFAVKASTFRSLWMDKRYVLSEDIEFAWRAAEAGARLHVVPALTLVSPKRGPRRLFGCMRTSQFEARLIGSRDGLARRPKLLESIRYRNGSLPDALTQWLALALGSWVLAAHKLYGRIG